MATYIVTGAAGFIGYHMCRRLLNEGHTVKGIDNLCEVYYPRWMKEARLTRLAQFSGFGFSRLDLRDARATREAIRAERDASLIVHLAAHACVPFSRLHPEETAGNNGESFRNVLEAAAALPELRCLVYASSSSVYGHQTPKEGGTIETEPVLPISPYGLSKAANERTARESREMLGGRIVGLRYFKVYGPESRPDTVFFKFVDRIYHGLPIDLFNFGDVQHSFTFIDDVVAGTLAVADRLACSAEAYGFDAFNLGSDRAVPLEACADHIGARLGRRVIKRRLPLPEGDRSYSLAGIERAKHALGFSPTTEIEAGLDRLIDWYLEVYLRTSGYPDKALSA